MNQPKSSALLLTFLLTACVERRDFRPLPDAAPLPTPSVPTLRLPANGDYRSLATSGARRPTFQWNASTWSGPEEIRYELELSTNRSFTTDVDKLETTGTSQQPREDLMSAGSPPVGSRYYWRVRACVGESCSDYSSVWSVNVGRVHRDLNGDGFADVAIVAAGNNPPASTAGRFYVFLGSASGVDATADSKILGNGDVWFRRAVAAGDLNGDGIGDIAALVSKQDLSMKRVLVYFGTTGASFDATPDLEVTAQSVSAGGDINGDGYDDLLVSSNSGNGILYGGKNDATIAPFNKGDAGRLHAAGDVNGDGYGDLLAVAGNEVQVYLGGQFAPSESAAGKLRGAGGGDFFGYSVASAGDVNSDGFADIVVGAPADATVGTNAGRAFIYFGKAGAAFDENPDGVFSVGEKFQLGFNVGAIGDVNGDGFGDVGIAYSKVDANDVASFYRGGLLVYLGGTGPLFDTTSDTTLDGEGSGAYYGECFGGSDVNGDGFDDLMIGSPGYESTGNTGDNVGRAYVYLGEAGRRLETLPDTTLNGEAIKSYFGDIVGDGVVTPGLIAPR